MPTANLALPYIEAAQAQKHVTHNEALARLDALVQLAVQDRDLGAPPASPVDGQCWIVKASPTPTGAWAGHGNHVAAWQDGAWQFSAARLGWIAYVVDEATLLAWNGSAWGDFFATVTALQNLSRLGLGTTADATNPFSAKLNNALWTARTVAEGGDGNLRGKLSKESAAKTASFLFQDNFSGRAEIGLTGDDDLHFKVSADGSTWFEGIRLDRNTGRIAFPVMGGPRETLAAARSYFVRTDGSNSNTGLVNNAAGAFLTIQKAIDTVAALDLNGFAVTVQVGDGTYSAGALVAQPFLAGPVTLQGNTTTPASCTIASSGGLGAIRVQNGARLTVAGFKLSTTSSACLAAEGPGCVITVAGPMEYGACALFQVFATEGGRIINAGNNYTVSGGALAHLYAENGSVAHAKSCTVTLTGTPAFSVAYASAFCGEVIGHACTFSGAATGKRYQCDNLGLIFANGGGANYFPGNAGGTTSGGGQYV
jgi:hypothetical protein